MKLEQCGVLPSIAQSMSQALKLLDETGAVIVQNVGGEAEHARSLALDLFGERAVAVPEPARVFDGGEMDRKAPGLDNTAALPAHTDGFGYGDLYPDYLLLDCVRTSEQGGENFLIDGYGVLAAMAEHEATRWVAQALQDVPMDQTEKDMQPSVSPIIQRTEAGRIMVRRTFDLRPAPGSADPSRDMAMVDAWHDCIDRAAQAAPRFKLRPGQALVVDNYRLFHGRNAYADLGRMMWRVWIWTRDSHSGPPDMPLHSDTRFAHA